MTPGELEAIGVLGQPPPISTHLPRKDGDMMPPAFCG